MPACHHLPRVLSTVPPAGLPLAPGHAGLAGLPRAMDIYGGDTSSHAGVPERGGASTPSPADTMGQLRTRWVEGRDVLSLGLVCPSCHPWVGGAAQHAPPFGWAGGLLSRLPRLGGVRSGGPGGLWVCEGTTTSPRGEYTQMPVTRGFDLKLCFIYNCI